MTNGDVHVFMELVRKDDQFKYSYDERNGEGYNIRKKVHRHSQSCSKSFVLLMEACGTVSLEASVYWLNGNNPSQLYCTIYCK